MKFLKNGVLFAALLALLGCKAVKTDEATIVDMVGREVRLPQKVEKVVALAAADCEILYALGEGNKLVGRGEFCDYPPEIDGVTVVQSGYETNVEQIIALKPQVVIMSQMAQSEEQVQSLEAAGIAVLVTNAQDIEGVYKAAGLIGAAVGSNKAQELIEDMKKVFDGIKKEENGEKKTVYFEVSPLKYNLWTAGSGTFMNELAEMVNLRNVFADVDGWAEVSQEQVIERNPDYIVTIEMYYGEGQMPVEEIMGRDGWGGISAIVNGRVFNANNDEISRPGPRLARAAQHLAEYIKNNE